MVGSHRGDGQPSAAGLGSRRSRQANHRAGTLDHRGKASNGHAYPLIRGRLKVPNRPEIATAAAGQARWWESDRDRACPREKPRHWRQSRRNSGPSSPTIDLDQSPRDAADTNRGTCDWYGTTSARHACSCDRNGADRRQLESALCKTCETARDSPSTVFPTLRGH